VRARTASVSAVMVLVTPGPWVTVTTPTFLVSRAYPSAMPVAPASCLAAMYWPPCTSVWAAMYFMLEWPMTPNMISTPLSASARATAWCTLVMRRPGGKAGTRSSWCRARA
jgi:hypothetical protein